jgi:hypothetical protein
MDFGRIALSAQSTARTFILSAFIHTAGCGSTDHIGLGVWRTVGNEYLGPTCTSSYSQPDLGSSATRNTGYCSGVVTVPAGSTVVLDFLFNAGPLDTSCYFQRMATCCGGQPATQDVPTIAGLVVEV